MVISSVKKGGNESLTTMELLTGFGLLYLGLKLGREYHWSIGNYAMYWLFFTQLSI